MSEQSMPQHESGSRPEEIMTFNEGRHIYHPESVDPSRVGGARVSDGLYNTYFDADAPAKAYDRDIDDYVEELEYKFIPAEWVGKKVLDIGAGAYDKFGREARKRGIDVVGINPALKEDKHIAYLQEAVAYDHAEKQSKANREFWEQPVWKRLFRKVSEVQPDQPRVVAAMAQAMPFADESFDAAVSVYGVPHYLHHVDSTLTDSTEILASYTSEVRRMDKLEIRDAFNEIFRVLKKGGKAFLTDDHSAPGQQENINAFSPSDGSEVVEVLEEMKREYGLSYEITETQPWENRGIKRVIVLQKPD